MARLISLSLLALALAFGFSGELWGQAKTNPQVEKGKPLAETNADLIVINSHKPGVEDYFLGSTASRVVRRAPCSVLVLR